MPSFLASCRFASSLAPSLFVFAVAAGSQTLEHRPPPKPPAPHDSAALVADEPVLAKGTSLQVEIDRHYPVKIGEPIEAHLLHPIYAQGKLAVLANTALRGRVVALQPDRKTRWHARLRGDFTPFHTVQVQFKELLLPSGPVAISADAAANGAPMLHLAAPGASPRQSLIAREWAAVKSQLHDRVDFFTAPGKGDRALQILYHELPYHPERIEVHTAWSFELNAPLDLPTLPAPIPDTVAPASVARNPEIWAVHAILSHDLTSATAKAGDPLEALVVEPVYDRDKQLVVPQGSILAGKVSAAKAARFFGRNGKLRFTFQQVQFPEGFSRNVQGALAGAATEKSQDLSLDAEGTISPRNQSRAVAPLLLSLLASRALDDDGDMIAHNGVASNGFGLVGRVVGVAAGNRNFAAGLGFYAAALSFYDNFLHTGGDVVFPKDTRIDIDTTPLRAPVLKPAGQ